MSISHLATAPLAVAGSPESTSFVLLLALVAVLAITLLGVLSALLDMVVYTGAAALVIGLIFYVSGGLSLNAGLRYVSTLLGLA